MILAEFWPPCFLYIPKPFVFHALFSRLPGGSGNCPIFFDKFLFCLDQLDFLSVACNPESYLAQQWEGLATMPGQQQVCNAGSFPSELVFCSYEFARAAITKHHQLRGIKKQHPLVSSTTLWFRHLA